MAIGFVGLFTVEFKTVIASAISVLIGSFWSSSESENSGTSPGLLSFDPDGANLGSGVIDSSDEDEFCVTLATSLVLGAINSFGSEGLVPSSGITGATVVDFCIFDGLDDFCAESDSELETRFRLFDLSLLFAFDSFCDSRWFSFSSFSSWF